MRLHFVKFYISLQVTLKSTKITNPTWRRICVSVPISREISAYYFNKNYREKWKTLFMFLYRKSYGIRVNGTEGLFMCPHFITRELWLISPFLYGPDCFTRFTKEHKNWHWRAEAAHAITRRKPKNYFSMPAFHSLFFLLPEILWVK